MKREAEASVWQFDWRKRFVMGRVEFALLVAIAAVIGASVADFTLAARHTSRLERAVHAGLATAVEKGDPVAPDLSGVREATLAYLGLEDRALPKGTTVSAVETCSCQKGILETMEGICPAPCQGADVVERKYVRVTFTQSHDWIMADGLMGQPNKLTVSRAVRVR